MNSALKPGAENTLVVRVDNSFDEKMLPRGNSYDWTIDGGIYRPVNLLVTPEVFIERLEVDALPDLRSGDADLQVRVFMRDTSRKPGPVEMVLTVIEEDTGREVLRVKHRGAPARLKLLKARLWHFDHPHLYRLTAEITGGHSYAQTFSVRKIEVRDGGFYLNGERVWLMGIERMAGSHPDHGMAEPASWIVHDHNDM